MMTTYNLIKISGTDAKKFLQGQLTCDMEKITAEQGSLAAHCSPKGRVISLFYLQLFNGDYYLLMHDDMISITLKALKKYAVFFKVTLEENPSLVPTLAPGILEKIDIKHGIARIYPETSEKFLAHDLNLDKLGAISFTKGCYTGQEIIARMSHRGTIKNRLHLANLNSQRTPTPGEDVFCDKKICGSLVDFKAIDKHHYLALLITNTLQATSHTRLVNDDEIFSGLREVSA